MFLEKITSFACLLGSGLNCIFHRKTHLLIFSKSEFNCFADISISQTFEKKEVSSAKIPSGRSFMKIQTKRGPNTDPCGTPNFSHLILLFVYDYADNL